MLNIEKLVSKLPLKTDALEHKVDTSRITPIMHYLGHVWVRHGLSPSDWSTIQGQVLYHMLAPADRLTMWTQKGMSFESMLLQRHRIIDYLLETQIRKGCEQVIELASGLSGRGLRFCKKYPKLHYIETDLPAALSIKKQLYSLVAPNPSHLETLPVNVLIDDGPQSMKLELLPRLQRRKQTVVIMEGLLNFFDKEDLLHIWRNISHLFKNLDSFGSYISEYHLGGGIHNHLIANFFSKLVGHYARGKVHFAFDDEEQLKRALMASGFKSVFYYNPIEFYKKLEIPRFGYGDLVTMFEAKYF